MTHRPSARARRAPHRPIGALVGTAVTLGASLALLAPAVASAQAVEAPNLLATPPISQATGRLVSTDLLDSSAPVTLGVPPR